MDNTEQLKQLARDLLNLLHRCCISSFSGEMFALENRAKQLGV